MLTLARDSALGLWAGTAGDGIYVLGDTVRHWQNLRHHRGDSTSITWDYVNSIAFGAHGVVWYGTVGNGFGRSTDGGRTWRSWSLDQLGPEWQYVAHHGIVTRGDTVYIATADGLRISPDAGDHWRCVVAADTAQGGADRADDCGEHIRALPNKYLLSLAVGPHGDIWVGHLQGLSVSRDGGRTWQTVADIPRTRVRAVTVSRDSSVWVATESDIYVDSTRTHTFHKAKIELPGWTGLPGAPRALIPSPDPMLSPQPLLPAIALSYGLAAADNDGQYRIYYLAIGDNYRPAADMWTMLWWGPPLWPIGAASTGLDRILAGDPGVWSGVGAQPEVLPADPRHPFVSRPIADSAANPFVDATYRYGSTMGGNFQEHQGVEFNNPAGTPVHAVAAGTVVFAGKAEAGANTVAIRHDQRAEDRYVFSAYYHNATLAVHAGQHVNAGDVISRVGNTGRATNDHLHLEIHLAPTPDSAAIVNPDQRYPPYTVNPQLWIRPRPGTGIVAGRVLDANGNPVQHARVYGLVLPYPVETPYTFAETYGQRAHPDPAYNENFAVGDVPAGSYLLGVQINGHRVWRQVRVQPDKVTFVAFRPTQN